MMCTCVYNKYINCDSREKNAKKILIYYLLNDRQVCLSYFSTNMTLTISCKIQSAFFWYIFILTNIHIDKLYSNDGGKEAPQDGITFSMTCSSCRV